MTKRRKPSILDNEPSRIISGNIMAGKRSHALSLKKRSLDGAIFCAIKNTRPSTSAIFIMLEPSTLATAISLCPLMLAAMLAAISGRLVPSAMRVAPIMNSLIL